MNLTALAFIKAHEGCRLTAYQDSAGVWTCGWGATGADITHGTVWTQEQADARLASDLESRERFLAQLLMRWGKPPLSEQQAAALLSLIFNVGETALAMSTLFRLVREGEWILAAKEFQRWDHAGGSELKGLLIRRFEEAAMFLRGSP